MSAQVVLKLVSALNLADSNPADIRETIGMLEKWNDAAWRLLSRTAGVPEADARTRRLVIQHYQQQAKIVYRRVS